MALPVSNPILFAATVLAAAPSDAACQDPEAPPTPPHITVTFEATPLNGVLDAFADLSGRSFVVAPGAAATVSARIQDQPWDLALEAILEAHDLETTEAASGILIVGPVLQATGQVPLEPLETRVFQIRWSPAHELADAVWSMLSGRGRVAVATSTNALVVTDEPGVLARVAAVLGTGG